MTYNEGFESWVWSGSFWGGDADGERGEGEEGFEGFSSSAAWRRKEVGPPCLAAGACVFWKIPGLERTDGCPG